MEVVGVSEEDLDPERGEIFTEYLSANRSLRRHKLKEWSGNRTVGGGEDAPASLVELVGDGKRKHALMLYRTAPASSILNTALAWHGTRGARELRNVGSDFLVSKEIGSGTGETVQEGNRLARLIRRWGDGDLNM